MEARLRSLMIEVQRTPNTKYIFEAKQMPQDSETDKHIVVMVFQPEAYQKAHKEYSNAYDLTDKEYGQLADEARKIAIEFFNKERR